MSELEKAGQQPERFKEGPEIHLGDWVWVAREKGDERDDGDEDRWFACVTEIGTNYVKVQSPPSEKSGGSYQRIHNDDIPDLVEVEPDFESVIEEFSDYWQKESRTLMRKAQKLLADLGLRDRSLPAPPAESTTSLAKVSGAIDVNKHKRALVKAKEKTLPDLFKRIAEANAEVARWMSARALPMMAQVEITKEAIEDISDRVFTIELYAGLLEKVVTVRDGEPAPLGTKLSIMQRRHYMDEECLVDYRVGGMEISNLRQFDEWIAEDAHFKRILPFPRCMVAFRVRRHIKTREWDGSWSGAFIKVRLENQDKLTYLYIRNGDRLYRMATELDFPAKLFPDRDHFILGQKMWAKMFCDTVDKMVTDGEHQAMLEEENEKRRKSREWRKENPNKSWVQNPYSSFNEDDPITELREYEPFDDTSVFYDEMVKKVEGEVKAHNKIAFIVQGLFDRSEVLHPHAPARLWTPEGFAEAVHLVYDDDRALNPTAKPPSFERLRAELNASIDVGTATVGQEDFWQRREAEKYNKRENDNWRNKHHHDKTHYRPYGNPGPGLIAKVARWQKRARRATYVWQRKRQYSWGYDNYRKRQREPHIETRITVPAAELLNCDAYEPGMYRQFYLDPRTRAQYLKWAPMLLAAEEYNAGNI